MNIWKYVVEFVDDLSENPGDVIIRHGILAAANAKDAIDILEDYYQDIVCYRGLYEINTCDVPIYDVEENLHDETLFCIANQVINITSPTV